jgi:D-sedoheptulose 7-phosphate isomerase
MIGSVNEYFGMLEGALSRVEREPLARAAELLASAVKEGRGIFVAGNGGSASTANHFAADFGKNIVKGDVDRPRVMSVTANVAAITAYANDEGYENAFSRQLTNFMREGDLLIVISASGNSPSVVKCIELARRRGATVIAMTGFSGGRLMELSDVCLHAPDNHYETVEDIHMMFCHLLVWCVKNALK